MTVQRELALWRVITVIYFIGVGYCLFANPSSLPQLKPFMFGFEADKFFHFAMFFPLPVLVFLSLGTERRKTPRAALTICAVFAAGAVIAGCTELIQNWLPLRSPELKDFRADALAMALSSLLFFICLPSSSGKQSSR